MIVGMRLKTRKGVWYRTRNRGLVPLKRQKKGSQEKKKRTMEKYVSQEELERTKPVWEQKSS